MPISKDDVSYGYRYLLGRLPENNDVIEYYSQAFEDVELFRQHLMESPEYKLKNPVAVTLRSPPVEMQRMYNDVRLVIWDLDETFWQGTLTEDGVRYSQRNHNIVVELARRGILSSICSKNDFESAKSKLQESAIWQYFVFPSIDWSSKAHRIAQIVQSSQLRAETILFVDDNPHNRAEVQAAIPGIQVAAETEIPNFLTHEAFQGKEDPELSRLQQYKLLEQKQLEISASGGGSIDFLRKSGITVSIIYDVEKHMDRAIEIINRTNQLNFTKKRLPAERSEAEKQLISEMSPFHCKAGLVSVKDKYGDYGICGFFLVSGMRAHGRPQLKYFAFSCRLLGMGVEQWLYALLDRPEVTIVGDVLSDLSTPVDWINVVGDTPTDEMGQQRFHIPEIRIRGGCELEVIEHFFRAAAGRIVTEFIRPHGCLYVPCQNSLLLNASMRPLSDVEIRIISELGMDETFYTTKMFEPCAPGTLILYSPTGDAILSPWQHVNNGFEVPVWFREPVLPNNPQRTREDEFEYERIAGFLSEKFIQQSQDSLERYEHAYHGILSNLPKEAFVIILLPNEFANHGGTPFELRIQRDLNDAFERSAAEFSNVSLLKMSSLLNTIDEVVDHYLHFDRAVYRRLFEEIHTRYKEWTQNYQRSLSISVVQ
ncbi:HAD-IIIC family phosphatase [Rhizobium sp. BK491]|uniref:HAD-IIIC family phosphatase n=1 Tax=Rhizobium sp. BK491 TaxID=2587009 RepID=UPI00162209DF|nr:HAD-IIIC family phosphatase [Rhizobium sp. BK491]MBB3569629.1 FkbH-like protein [Rhizobium sp. BK491]